MNVVGIDIGAARHVAAVCREGKSQAERPVLRISSRRAGFDELDGWMARQDLVGLGSRALRGALDAPTCLSALAVLRQAPTAAAVGRKRSSTLARAARPGGGRAIGPKRAEQLKTVAERTVAPPELEEQVGFE